MDAIVEAGNALRSEPDHSVADEFGEGSAILVDRIKNKPVVLLGRAGTMRQTPVVFVLGVLVSALGLLTVGADDKSTEIKGGIEGKVVRVDVEGKKLTIATGRGQQRTFAITDETQMFGPRGGKVKKHLHDRRFHEGFPVTIVADGNTAEEVHLGFAKDAAGFKGDDAKSTATPARPERPSAPLDRSKVEKTPTNPPPVVAQTSKETARHKEATKLEDEDDETEIPGQIKSFDASTRHLVLTLANGKHRSFILAHDVPVRIKGAAAASAKGLNDPDLKVGVTINVFTDEAGHKVKELEIVPASQIKRKKAG
jgi:hypothetical protein